MANANVLDQNSTESVRLDWTTDSDWSSITSRDNLTRHHWLLVNLLIVRSTLSYQKIIVIFFSKMQNSPKLLKPLPKFLMFKVNIRTVSESVKTHGLNVALRFDVRNCCRNSKPNRNIEKRCDWSFIKNSFWSHPCYHQGPRNGSMTSSLLRQICYVIAPTEFIEPMKSRES